VKTSTSEVRCDRCRDVIPAMHPTAVFVTLRGPRVGHRKFDFCNLDCFQFWTRHIVNLDTTR